MTTPSMRALLVTVKTALLAGGREIQKRASHVRQVSFKSPLSPVTQVDVASEKAVVSCIRKKFPDHVFLSEEMAHFKNAPIVTYPSDRYRWIIDPLDGTVNFVHRIPQSCVSVAVERNGVVLAGGVYDPYREELFLAAKGYGARMNNRRIHVSGQSKMNKSLVVTGFPYERSDNPKKYLLVLSPFLKRCADLRRFGAAALDLAWVACGRVEIYLEYKLSPWDVAAGWLLVKEAGGKVTDFHGRSPVVDDPKTTLATNGRVHSRALRLIKP
jgi:myo-inositol-1(or 4)-monophosphatase